MATWSVARTMPMTCAALAILLAAGSVLAQPISGLRSSSEIPVPFPGGPLIFIPKQPAKPGSIILTAEQYKELIERLEKLQAQVDAQRPLRPRSCELEGKVEIRGKQPVVRLRATFRFSTTRPRTIVHLGCQKTHPIEAHSDDGKTPLLTAADDGLRVLAETAGDHTIRLELEVPLTPRGPKGAELGFEIGLPGSPITALTFEAPTNVRRYNLTTKTPRVGSAGVANTETETEQPEVDRFLPGKGGVPLGPITNLVISWDDPNRVADSVRSAVAELTITVGATELHTDTRLRLRGPGTEWKFTAPSTADVSVGIWTRPGAKALDFLADRAPNVVRPDPGQSVWRIVFRESFVGDLLVTVTTKQPRPPSGEPGSLGPFALGPFDVLNVPRFDGTIRVKSPTSLRPTLTIKGDSSREVDEASGEAVYRFTRPEVKAPSSEPTGTMNLAQVPGVVHARVRHELRLTEAGWKLRSEIAIAPSRTEIEHLDIELPASFRPSQTEPAEIVEDFSVLRESGRDRQIYRARFSAPKRTSFSITIEGDFPLPAGPGAATLSLPKVLGVSERSAELVASSPTRFDLRGSARTFENGKESGWSIPLNPDPSDSGRRLRLTVERSIATAELTWRVAASEAAVRSEADVEFDDSRVRVVQRLHFRFSGNPPDRVHLQATRPIVGLQASGGTLEAAGSEFNVLLPAQAGRDWTLSLAYSASLAEKDTSFTLPQVVTDSGELSQVIRIWSVSNRTIQPIDSPDWTESPTEIVDGRSTLPALVVKSVGRVLPPTLTLGPVQPPNESGPNIERLRVEVLLGEETAAYRCQYWIRDWRQQLELALPASARLIDVYIEGKRVSANILVTGQPSRIVLNPAAGTPAIVLVEVAYRGPSSLLQSPTIVRGRLNSSAIWSIEPQAGSIAIVPRHTVDSWSLGTFCHVVGVARFLPVDHDFRRGAVTCQTAEQQIAVYQVQRTPWVVVTSIAGLAIGFTLVAVRRRVRVVVVSLCVAGLLACVFLSPQPIALATFAAIPGLVAFALVLWTYQWMRWRYRRRLARFTGFARPGSSLVRPSASRTVGSSARERAPADVSAPSSR